MSRPGHEVAADGELIGRDPRQMSGDELAELGHKPMSPLRALRLRCIDCCAGQPAEVRKCTAVDCSSWPFRMGSNPYRKKAELSDEERARRAALLHPAPEIQRAKREVGLEGTRGTPEAA